MEEAIKFLTGIWKSQAETGDYVFLCTRQPDNWKDHPIKVDQDLVKNIKQLMKSYPPDKYDLYFCPVPFTKRRRVKEYVKRTVYLWQDLDYVDPKYLKDELKPSMAWESSPGRYHGLWKLDRHYTPEEYGEVNKSLAYFIGADKGGWDDTQVLRIPGTRNHKYESLPVVKLLWDNGKVISVDRVRELTESSEVVDDTDSRMKELDPDGVLMKNRRKLDRKVLQILLAKHATQGKRSDILWYLHNELHDAGLTPNEIYSLIKNSVWNKFKGRHDEEMRLKNEIKKVIAGSFEEGERKSEKPRTSTSDDEEETDDNDGDENLNGLLVESYSDVMSDISSHPGWLVEGFWGRRSHGIVAGEPKSFKSTLITDLAMAVASGTPFLNQFPVLEPGPVLYIQNENASWIMKDKMEKFIANRELGGDVKIIKGKGKKKLRMRIRFPKDLPIHFINQQGFLVNDPIHQMIVEKLIKDIKPVLIIFDPLYLMFDGDVNSAKDLQPALNWMLHLKNAFKTGVIVIHHYNKGGGAGSNSGRGGQRMLGSTTLHGWVESAWYLSHPPSEDEDEETEEEEVDKDDVDKSSGKPTTIILNREFRFAGGFSKINVNLVLGEIGTPTYDVDVARYVPPEKKGRGVKINDDDVKNTITNHMEMSTEPQSVNKLAQVVGCSRKVLTRVIDQMIQEGVLKYDGQQRIALREA